MRRMKTLLDEQRKLNPNATFDDVLRSEKEENIESVITDFWKYNQSSRRIVLLEQHFKNNGFTDLEVKKVVSHVIPILEGFLGKNRKNFVIQSLGSTAVFVEPSLLRMPSEIENLLSQKLRQNPTSKFVGAQTYRDIYDALFRESMSGFHHVSKTGDRARRDGRPIPLHDVEKASNALADTQPRVFESGRPDMESQTLIGLDGIQNYAIFTIGRTADPTESSMGLSTTFVTPATSFSVMSPSSAVKAGTKATTDMQVFPSKWAPLATLGANKGGVNVSINAMLAMNGLSPFLYGEGGGIISRGSLYKHVESGRFSDILEYMYANAFPKEYAELMQSSQGVNPFRNHTKVRRIATSTWTKGINTPEEQAVFHYATYLSQILTGMEMVNGTEFGVAAGNLMRNDLIRTEGRAQAILRDADFFTDQFLGAGSVNEGVARIVLLAERMGWGVVTGGNAFVNFVKSRSEDADTTKSASAFVKQMENVGTEIEGILKASGFDKTKPLSPVKTYGSPQMMVGGFFGSMNATEKMMEAAGMLRRVKTENGIHYKAFEFSDKGASLILGAVDEKVHLLPFINDLDSPQKGYDSFIKNYTSAVQSNDAVAVSNLVSQIPMVKLGDILKHDLLYRFYPSLKNVNVGFVEGFGASFNPRQNVIRIGIDRIISGSIAEANGVSSDHVLIPESVRINSVVGSLIHEVQHAVQRLETWTQSADVSQSAQYRRGIFKYLVRNMMGLEGAYLAPLTEKKGKGIQAEIELAKEAGLDDAEISKALELSPQEIEKGMMELLDSPLAQRVGQLAIPNAIQLFMSDAMVLERLSHEMTQGTAEAAKMAELAKEMLTLHEQAQELKKKLDDGVINAEQAHAVLVGKNESLYVLRTNLYEVIEATMGKDVSSLAYEYSSHHSKYAELMLDVTRLTDIIKHDPKNGAGFNTVRLRYLIESLGLMQYYGQMHEKQAYETASRKDMSQDELNKSVRPSDDIFGGTTTIGTKNNLRQLGVMLKEGKTLRVNMMIGGYGMGQNVATNLGDTLKLETLRRVARMSTISYYGHVIDASIKNLNRFIVSAKGWEVIDGKARLVYKTGIIQANSRVRNLKDYSNREKIVPVYENMDDGYDTNFAIYNGLSENLQNSISMEEVARLVDGKVVLENELVTPTEAIDVVYRPDFPDYVDVEELPAVLSRMGVSDEGIMMANVSAIMTGFAGSRLSKEELVNVMAVHHQFIVAEHAYGDTFGQGRLTKALEQSEKTPQSLMSAMRKVWRDNMAHHLRTALSDMGVGIYPWAPEHDKPKMHSLFMAKRGKIQFTPARPDFISEADWNEWVNRKKADGTWPKGKGYMIVDTDQVYGVTGFYESDSRLDRQVEDLNKLYAYRLMSIKPYFEAFMAKIDDIDVNLKMAMIDDAILLSTRVEPEAAIAGVDRYEGEYGIVNLLEQEIGNKGQRAEYDETLGKVAKKTAVGDNTPKITLRPFGPSLLLSNVLRVTGSASDADLFGIQHILLPSVGHTFDRGINTQRTDAMTSGSGIHPRSLTQVRDEFGVVQYTKEAKQGYDLDIINPYNMANDRTGATAGGTANTNAIGALKAIGASHQGLAMIVQAMIMQSTDNFTRIQRRIIPEQLTPEIIQALEAEKVEIMGVLRGMHHVATTITDALIDRQGLLLPFNETRREHLIHNLRQKGDVGQGWGYTPTTRTKGFIAKDGSISIESVDENVLNGSNSHNEIVGIPYENPPVSSGTVGDTTNDAIGRLKGVVFSAVVAELERAFIVNGELDSAYGSGVASQTIRKGGDVHQVLNSIIRNGEPVHPNDVREGKNVQLRQRNQVVFTGVHAVHSAFYQLLARHGINSATVISNAVQASPEFLTFLSNTNYGYSNRVAPVLVQGDASYVDIDLYATAMVPILTKAFAERTITYVDGTIKYGDILNEQQRAIFNELLSHATTATVPVEGQADGFVEMTRSFLETLSQTQKTLIAEMCSDVNSNMLLESIISGMQGMAAVELIPDSPAMEAIIPDFKEKMRNAVRSYIVTGSYQWEKGVREGIADPVQRKHADSELPYKNAIFQMLSNGNADAFAKFLIGIKKLNRFEAYEAVRGGKNARLEGPQYGATNQEGGPTLRALFRGSVRMNEFSWSAINADSSFGDITRKLILGPDTSVINRTHALENPDSLSKQTPVYIGVNKIEGVGMGDALLAPLKLDMADALVAKPPSQGVSLSGGKVFIPKKAASISKPFSRRMLVDAIIKEADKAGTDRVSIQPTRNATVGRPFFDKATILRANETGMSGKKGFLLDVGIKQIPLGGMYSPVVRDDMVTGGGVSKSAPAEYGEKASTGFAFKRLEDGRIVINISGDVLGYKNFTTLSNRSGWGEMAIGVNLEEALGYSHSDGGISPMHLKYWAGENGIRRETLHVGSLMDVHGAAWRIEILKKARAILNGGAHSIKGVNQKLMLSEAGYVTRENVEALERIKSGTASHGNVADVITASALLRDSSTDNYLTLTLDAGLSQEQVFQKLMTFMMEASLVREYMKNVGQGFDISNQSYNSISGTVSSSLTNQGGGLMNALFSETPATQRLRDVPMGDEPSQSYVGGSVQQALEQYVLAVHRKSNSGNSGPKSSMVNSDGAHRLAESIATQYPHLIGDLQKLATMASTSDHGYLMPDLERTLAMNGEKRSLIEQLFPNRPELTQFAWDNTSNSNVSIIPKREGKKVVSYLVGYDIPSGIDKNTGQVTMSRRVTSVRTLSEAEALKAKYSLSTTKAELANAIETLSNRSGKFAVTTLEGGKSQFAPVRRNVGHKFAEVEKGSGNYTLSYINSDTYTVGDLDLRLTKEQAEALSAQLSLPEAIQAQVTPRVNMMVGENSSNAKELESLLRRKINFGVGMGRVEFSSKLMGVIAHGKAKNGKNKYPETMTGAEWYKFIRENAVSKDEIRMSGLAFLLNDNKNSQISRSELAEFVYTTYPRNYRQDRGGPLASVDTLNALRGGVPQNQFVYPFIFNIEAKEAQVAQAHVSNMNNILTVIDTLKQTEPENATALESAISKTIDELIDVSGLPKEMGDGSLKERFDKIIGVVNGQYSPESFNPREFAVGSTRKVRPMHLDIIVRSAIEAKMTDVNGIVRSVVPESALGLTDPWNWAYSHHGMGFTGAGIAAEGVPLSGSRGFLNDPQRYGSMERRDAEVWQQGVIFSGGNSHDGYATYRGMYTSSIWLTELWSPRMREEFEKFTAILETRKVRSTNPEDIRRIDSIIKSAERVAIIRSAWNEHNDGRAGNAGHYETKMTGMFQLGHIRTTAGVMLASHGAESVGQGIAFADETNKVLGVQKEIEPTFMVEEIQSDTFQYRSFGDTVEPEYAMPDSLEQAEGLNNVSELTSLRQELARLNETQEETLNTLFEFAKNAGYATNSTNIQFYRRLMPAFLETIGQVERYLIKRDFEANHGDPENRPILKPSGGMVKLSEEHASYLGVSEIPRLEWDTKADSRLMKGIAEGLFKSVTPAFNEILGDMFGIRSLKEGNESIYDVSQMSKSHAATPMVVMMQYAMLDEQAQMSAREFKNALLERRNPNFDFNAMADRLVDRIEKAVNAWASNDPVFNRNSYSTKFAKVKTLRAFVQMLRDMQKESVNSFLMPTLDITGSDYQQTSNEQNLPAWREALRTGARIDVINNDSLAEMMDGLGKVFEIRDDAIKGWRKPEEYSATNPASMYALTPRSEVASNALARFLLNTMGVIAVQAEVGDTPKRISMVNAKMAELAKKIPVSTSGSRQPQIITSQPYGIEDIYRPISIQGTVLRAANAGYRQVGMTDARHHFVRGHTSETKVNMVLGRRKRVFVNIDKDTGLVGYGMKLLRMLPENRFMEVHGKFFERLANMEDVELRALLEGKDIEHNGVNCGFHRHCILAIKDAPELLESGDHRIREIHGYSMDRFADGRDGVRHLGIGWGMSQIADAFDHDQGGNALLTDDGKPIAYRKAGNTWWDRNYGTLVSGEKTDTQRQYDSSAANFDRIWFISEANKGSGYINNYGLPMWYLRTNYVGQSEKNLVKFATDAFERPVLEMGNDGMYRILDKKTAKLILESNEPERVREVLLQNSKYLGSLPYVASFLSQWQSVGAYVFSGYGYGVPLDHQYVNSDNFSQVTMKYGSGTPESLRFMNMNLSNERIPEMTFHPKDGQIKDRSQVYIRGSEEASTEHTAMGHTTKNGAGRAWRQIPTTVENVPLNVLTKMAFGLEANDTNMAKVLRLMNSNGSTIFRFAPNFQTDAQRTAFRQKAVAGIPSMMVGDVSPDGTPQANPRMLQWLTNVASNYEKRGKIVKALYDAVRENLDYETAGKRHGTDRKSVAAVATQLRSQGIPIPKQMSSNFGDAEREINPETGRYRIPEKTIQLMKQMRNSGHTYKEIGEAVGVHKTIARQYLNQSKDDYRPERADPTEPYGGPHA